MIFLSADEHYSHARVIDFCARPFKDVKEMDETLISNFNELVSESDITYHLGDFSLSRPQHVNNLLRRLHGTHILVLGGPTHDRHPELCDWSKICYGAELLFPMIDDHKARVPIVMSHFSMRVWPRSHYGSYHVHGHSHGKLPPYGLSFDVGVDCWDYKPISIVQVYEYAEKLKEKIEADKFVLHSSGKDV